MTLDTPLLLSFAPASEGSYRMPKHIPADSTIATVWPHLTAQRNYVSGALQKMRQCNAARGNSFIRVGVTGTGQKPYYKVFYHAPDGAEVIFGSFYDNHDELENGFSQTYNWNSKHMSFDEVLNFYADSIGHKGKRA